EAAFEIAGEFRRQIDAIKAHHESCKYGITAVRLTLVLWRHLISFARRNRLAREREQVKVRIESKAPTRIDLAGGTLDIWPLYLFHEGALTVNCAITRYASCVIEVAPEKTRRIVLASRDTKRKESFPSLEALCRAPRYKLPLLAQLVRVFRPTMGFMLTTDSEAPAGAGIGGSSAMAVAICAALDALTGAGLRREDW